MAKSPHSHKTSERKKVEDDVPAQSKPSGALSNPAVITAIITGIVAVVVAMINILPQLMKNYLTPPGTSQVSPVAIATQPLSTIAPTLTIAPTSPPTSTPMTIPPTLGIPSLTCLNGWQITSNDSSFQASAEVRDSCASSIQALGITAVQDQLQFALSGFRKIGIYGIAAPIPPRANFNVVVKETSVDSNQDAEFWLAFSNDRLPTQNMVIFAFEPQAGELRLYQNSIDSYKGKYPWSSLSKTVPRLPYVYDFNFSITGNSITTQINGIPLSPVIVNSPNYIFLGLRNKSNNYPVQMQFEISGLETAVGNEH